MAVSGIGAYSSQAMSLAEILAEARKSQEQQNDTSGILDAALGGNNASSGETLSSYMMNNSAAVQAIFDEIESLTGGTLTFSKVKEYQDELQRQFNEAVKEDLQKMGVDPNAEFTLASDGEGGIKVLCDSPEDKEKIEAYFEQNPEMVESFNKIQTLSNLDKARKEQGYSMEELKQRTQVESLAQWWSSDGTDYSQYMYYNQDTMLQFLGVSSQV